MRGECEADAALSGPRLRALVEDALARSALGHRAFPPALAKLFERDTGAARARYLRRTLAAGIGFYVIVLVVMNSFVIIKPSWRMVALQFAITPPAAILFGCLGFRDRASAVLRESGALAVSCLFPLSVTLAVMASPTDTVVMNLFMVSLPVVFVLFIARLRFSYAAMFTVVSWLALAAALAWRDDVPAAVRGYPMGFLVASSLPALYGVFQLELGDRRDYLHGVLQRLSIEELARQNEMLAALSATDPLTGAANRRELDAVLARLRNTGAAAAVLLADVDHFKQFNDRHGHSAGDFCLRSVAQTIGAQLRDTDVLARFGGEEFAVVMPNSGLAEAAAVAERIRAAVEAHVVTVEGRLVSVTVSLGIAQLPPGGDPAEMIRAADDALYAAKRGGRNCVRFEGAKACLAPRVNQD